MKDIDTLESLDDVLASTALKWSEMPDKIAVRDGGEDLTYAMFDGRANHLARMLDDMGAKPGDFIGYLGPTGIPFTVTFFACMKAGFVFMPMSPKFPPKSIAAILGAAQARFYVSDEAMPEDAEGVMAVGLPGKDEDSTPFKASGIKPDGLFFASSTSGSTGIPKIVAHERDAMMSFVRGDPPSVGVDENSVVGHAGTMWAVSLLSALSVGATLTCYDVTQGSPQDLFDWLASEKVSYWFTYPALFRTLAQAQGVLPDMRTIMLCGEPIFRHDFELFERLTTPGAALANLYAQQEFYRASMFTIRNGERLKHERIPAGQPPADNDLLILDPDRQPVGPRGIGEITHRSHRVPPGYVGNPERTAKVFWMGDDGVRRFATGDLGYFDAEGVLHIVGRVDDQIKIRNFNVQPVDIEQEIKPHPEVGAVAVTVSYCARGLPRLACYYEGTAVPGDLKAWLTDRIPAFMMPQFFVPVETLPRTPTGKVQRNMLELPEGLSEAHRVPASSQDEKILVDIWQQVLGHSDFGITDNFFDVGGDSLRAMELLMLMNQRFGRLLTLDRVILAGGTIEALAELIAQPSEQSQLRTLKPGDGGRHIVVGHVYGGGVTDYLEFARAIGGGIQVSGICADYSQRNRAYRVQQKAQEAVAHVPTDPLPVMMGYSFGGRVAFEIAHLLGHGERIVLVDPVGPFSERWHERLKGQLKSLVLPSPGLGMERTYPGDYRYRPVPLKTKGALLVTCDTSLAADVEGWCSVLDGPVETFNVPGNHWDILRGANALNIAAKVQDWLEQAGD